jgi:valyl-tRNA synthetase
VLCTAREIITLWVTRMVMMGQYCVGDIPFKDVYIHAMIQDGQGRKMSKSLGNGIDPLVAIDSHGADAMRFTLASMTTETQDVRMPVEQMTLPDGRVANTSPKFDIGRSFCNKLWNASRFAMMNMEGVDPAGFDKNKITITDKWILSRLAQTIADVTGALNEFKYSESLTQLYRFFWNDFCDWYLEWAKPRMQDQQQKPIAQNVLAFVLDQILRLLHPFVPFITEGMFQKLNEIAPVRGLKGMAEAKSSDALAVAEWPNKIDFLQNKEVEEQIAIIQAAIRTIRDIRSQYNKKPGDKLKVSINAPQQAASILNENAPLICHLANLKEFTAGQEIDKPENAAATIVEQMQIYLHDAIDRQAERQKLQTQKQQIENAKKAVEAKLANENYITKAKPQVVEETRNKLTELSKQLKGVEKLLSELDRL